MIVIEGLAKLATKHAAGIHQNGLSKVNPNEYPQYMPRKKYSAWSPRTVSSAYPQG